MNLFFLNISESVRTNPLISNRSIKALSAMLISGTKQVPFTWFRLCHMAVVAVLPVGGKWSNIGSFLSSSCLTFNNSLRRLVFFPFLNNFVCNSVQEYTIWVTTNIVNFRTGNIKIRVLKSQQNASAHSLNLACFAVKYPWPLCIIACWYHYPFLSSSKYHIIVFSTFSLPFT